MAKLTTRGRQAPGLLGNEGLWMLRSPGREADRDVGVKVRMLIMNSHTVAAGGTREARASRGREAIARALRLRSAGPESATGGG